jgi:hypothetical protein
MDDWTPGRVNREAGRWAPSAMFVGWMAVIVVAAGILLPGYFVAGWFQTHNASRSFSITVHSMQYQTTLTGEMQQHVTNIIGPGGLASQRTSLPASSPEQQVIRSGELNEINQLCTESVNFIPQDGPPGAAQIQTIISQNCLAGTPVANPPLANPVTGGN